MRKFMRYVANFIKLTDKNMKQVTANFENHEERLQDLESAMYNNSRVVGFIHPETDAELEIEVEERRGKR